MARSWSVGSDVCRCDDVPYPYSWAQAPDDNFCEGVLAWHIEDCRFGDVALDGLNVLGFGTFDGNVWEGTGRRVTTRPE